jgi:hypothetical protein
MELPADPSKEVVEIILMEKQNSRQHWDTLYNGLY